MSFSINVTAEDDWFSPAGELRQHAQLLIVDISLNHIMNHFRMNSGGSREFTVMRGVFLQEHLIQKDVFPHRFLVKAGVVDRSGPMIRVAFTVNRKEAEIGFAKCLYGARASEDTFNLRRTLKQMDESTDALWDNTEGDTCGELLSYVPLSSPRIVQQGREWTSLCRP